MLQFSKYHGTGNDFILLDGFKKSIDLRTAVIRQLCDRHFGIGADGLIVVRPSESHDYIMDYYNADGALGSMCGNGARCAFQFALDRNYITPKARFTAFDGLHEAQLLDDDRISISMRDVGSVTMYGASGSDYILDTGSPHFVRFQEHVDDLDVFRLGRQIRNWEQFREKGINVNFAEVQNGKVRLRTYERGVEDVTLSCGTGATATALAYATHSGLLEGPVDLIADGGELRIGFRKSGDRFEDIVLQGPASHVFDGTLNL